MSKKILVATKNSLFVAISSFGSAGLNFLMMLVFARYLEPDQFGSFIQSQSGVLVWLFLCDLGLSNGLTAVLTFNDSTRAMVLPVFYRVLGVRIFGSIVALGFVSLFSSLSDPEHYWQHLAFTPYLFGNAFLSSFAAYLYYSGRQLVASNCNLMGTLIAFLINIYFVTHGYSLTTILFTQSLSALFAALLMRFSIRFPDPSNAIENREINIWKLLVQDSWPHAIIFASVTLWSRIDQLAVAHWLGLSEAGLYGLTVRFISIPLLAVSAFTVVLFPELQRLGRDAPEKICLYTAFAVKLSFRWGLPLAILFLYLLSLVVIPLAPKYAPALKLLYWFAPGVWAYWNYNFTCNALLGFRRYKEVSIAYLLALTTFVALIYPMTTYFGILGTIWDFNFFCLSLFAISYALLLKGETSMGYPWSKFGIEENVLFNKLLKRSS